MKLEIQWNKSPEYPFNEADRRCVQSKLKLIEPYLSIIANTLRKLSHESKKNTFITTLEFKPIKAHLEDRFNLGDRLPFNFLFYSFDPTSFSIDIVLEKSDFVIGRVTNINFADVLQKQKTRKGIRCIKDRRKKCEIFIQLPNWTEKWLNVCANCPKGTGWTLEQAISIEKADDSFA